MKQPLLPQRPIGLGNQVADELRRQIITQQLPTGALLVEEKLAAEFQVSRGPIRDAIRALTSEGLVMSSGRSASVLGLSAHDIDELFTLRASLEQLALSSALQDYADELDSLLTGALREMDDAVAAGDADAFTHADVRFHSAFYTAAHHRRLADVWGQYLPTIQNLLLVANLEHTDLAPSLHRHVVLADLISARSADEAAAELHDHLASSQMRVRGEYAGA
jgi:GntR family transcriptional regulator of gluconate operon